MLLQKEIRLEYGWFYYYLLMLPSFLGHCQVVDSQADDILLRVNKVKKDLGKAYLTNGDFGHSKLRQNQQHIIKMFIGFRSGSGYSFTRFYKECTSIYASGSTSSGIYPIWLKERFQFTYVYCDMNLVSTKKGWTTIQRRMNGKINFERGWDDYVKGFGNPNGEHWLGLENIYRLSRQATINKLGRTIIQRPEIGFDLEDWDGEKAFVQYEYLRFKPKAYNYWLNVNGLKEASNFSITPIYISEFSTPDRDNDNKDRHCASDHKSGWWFHYCDESNLNGPYPRYKQKMSWDNIYWENWIFLNPNNTALRFVSMKFYYDSGEP